MAKETTDANLDASAETHTVEAHPPGATPPEQRALAQEPGLPPIVARMVIEIRSDGSRTVAPRSARRPGLG
jgi:hypothetical protein